MNSLSTETQVAIHRIVTVWLLVWAFCLPISIAGSSVLYFPLLGLYVLGVYWTFRIWPPSWGRIEILFLIFWGVSVISALAGADPMHSRVRLGKDLYFMIVILLGALTTNQESRDRLMKYFLWGSLMAAAMGVLQYVCGVNQTDSHGGTFLHLPTVMAHWPRPLLDLLSLVDGRATGPRSHPITYAESLLFPIAYVLSLLTDNSWNPGWKGFLWLGILVAALIVSQSRGAWIAFLVMGAVLLLLDPNARVMHRLAWIVILPLVLVLCVPSMRHRVQSISNTGYLPNAERLIMWQVGEKIFKAHPVLGIGPGNVVLVSPQYQTKEQNQQFGPWGHLHNTFITIAVERGGVGLIAFLIFILTLAWQLFEAYQRDRQSAHTNRVIYLTALLSLAGWLVCGLTEATYNDSTIAMMFYFVMGLALAS